MSKTDLRARPMFACTEAPSKPAHLTIVFAAGRFGKFKHARPGLRNVLRQATTLRFSHHRHQ